MRFFLLIVFLFLNLVILQVNQATEKLISQVVAQVGSEVLTSRDVKISYFVEWALFAPKDVLKTITPSIFSEQLNALQVEWMVYFEAQAFADTSLEGLDISKRYGQVLRLLDIKKEWKEIEVGEKELRFVVERKLKSQKLIQFKSESAMGVITDAEAHNYFEKNRTKFGTLPYSSFKEKIKHFLRQKQAEKRLAEWLNVLRKKYQVKNENE